VERSRNRANYGFCFRWRARWVGRVMRKRKGSCPGDGARPRFDGFFMRFPVVETAGGADRGLARREHQVPRKILRSDQDGSVDSPSGSRGTQAWCKRQRVVGASRQRLWLSSVPGLACQWLLTTWATKRILAGPLVDSFLQRLGWLALGQRFTLQELPATGPFGGHVAAGQQAVMPKAHELLGQDMQQEAANEFRRRQGHDLELVAVGIILVTKTDLSCVHRYQAAIRNGHAVAVTPQVAEHLRGAAERSLGVNYPVLAVPRIQPPAKNLRFDQCGQSA